MGRVTHVGLPIGKGQFQSLHLHVDGLGAVMPHGAQVVTLQDIQRLQQGNTLGPGAVGVQLVPPVGRGERFLQRRGILGEVFVCVQPAEVLQGLYHAAGDIALVKHIAGGLQGGGPVPGPASGPAAPPRP